MADDLGKSLSKLHKASCRVDEVTGLQELSICLNPLDPPRTWKKLDIFCSCVIGFCRPVSRKNDGEN
jgi:hypothetical protein